MLSVDHCVERDSWIVIFWIHPHDALSAHAPSHRAGPCILDSNTERQHDAPALRILECGMSSLGLATRVESRTSGLWIL